MRIGRTICTLMAIATASIAMAQRIICQTSRLRDGDLLFQVPLSENAITRSTAHGKDMPFDHVGIFHIEEGEPMVIEAVYEGVVETPFEEFAKRGKQIFAGRVRGADVGKSIKNAKNHLGKPYDFVFSQDDQTLYCSELVEKSFVGKTGQKLFSTIPMSFHDQTGRIMPYWEDFYSRRMMSVPEGAPGTNPMELSARKCVKIKYQWCGIDK